MSDGNFQKLLKTQWENIETGISTYEKLVCEMMKTVGNCDSLDNLKLKSEEKGEVIGEEIYVEILRPILKKNKFLFSEENRKEIELEKDDGNKNKKKGKKEKEEKEKDKGGKNNKKSGGGMGKLKEKKEDIILMNVNKEKLEKKLLRLLEIYSCKDKSNTQNYEIENEDILEFKLIIFFFIAKNLNNNYCIETKEAFLEAIIGLSTILNKLKNHLEIYLKTNENKKPKANNKSLLELKSGGKEKIENQEDLDVIFISHITRKPAIFSETCLKDFEEILQDMKITVEYNPIEILTKYPKLLNYNVFTERYYKLKVIEAFDHQLQVLELLRNSFEDFNTNLKIKANLIYLKTSIGSGKTTLAIAIASLINNIRNITKIQEYSLIFACSIDIVREYVGRMAYNSGISFAIASSRFSEVKIINSFSCREVKNVNLIITDYPTADLLLSKSKNYILFIDEPTNKADEKDSKLLKSFSQLFRKAPPNLILSSATLPSIEEMQPFQNYFKYLNYPTALITNITAGYSFIGCQINDFYLNPYIPHHSCTNKNELFSVFQNIFDDPLLSRCYNSFIMVDLYEKMNKYFNEFKIDIKLKSKLPDIKTYFLNIENLKYSKVVDMCKSLLLVLIESENDELIEKVCQSNSCLFSYMTNKDNSDKDNNNSNKGIL
jgi:hypothetical protein